MSSPSSPSVARTAVLLGLLVALTVIGSSAVSVALPRVGDDLSLDTAGTAWVMVAFSLSFSVTTAIFGRLADLRGLRLPLRIGVALFAAGSLLGAGAWSFPSILAGRLLQGAGAGAVPVLALGVISARFTGEARGRALGGLTAVVSVVSGSGPLIGGAITQAFGWRAVLALPAVALLVLEPVARIAPSGSVIEGRLDWTGAGLVAGVSTGAVLVLQSPATGTGLPTVAGAVLLLLAGALLARHVRRRPSGLLPRTVLANRVVVGSGLVGLALMAAYIGSMVAVPQIFARELGWTPLRIGAWLLPAAATGAVVSRLVGGTARRLGRYRVVIGLALVSATGLLVAAAGHDTPAVVIGGLALVFAAFGGGQVALVDGIPEATEEHVRGVALGVFNLIFFAGGAVGSAIIGGVGQAVSLPVALACVAVLPAAGAVGAAVVRRRARPTGDTVAVAPRVSPLG